MKTILSLLLLLISNICIAQTPAVKFNLDFEQTTESALPDHWFQWGDYALQKDSLTVHSGKYAASITADESGGSFGSIAYRIPANYDGEAISLEGYMKIEHVESGFAGLLLRIDGNNAPLAFDNMQNQNIHGTKDWARYHITLPFPHGADNIYVAGILVGKGKAWFDDFTVRIDGQDIQHLKEVERPVAKATLDKEFDAGSDFTLHQVNQQQKENLFKLCKIWGYVKYHHPQIAEGNKHWDYELFRILPAINANTFNAEVSDWIKSVGTFNESKEKQPLQDNIKLYPSTAWVTDENFLSKGISQELVKIQHAARGRLHYYIDFVPGVGNPIFKNENPYPNMKWDDSGYQLLALFRFWNMIEYFFPYKHLIDKDWDQVLEEYIPKVVTCRDELSYKLNMLELIGEIQDTHADIRQQDEVLSQFYGKKVAPIQLGFVEDKAVVVRVLEQLGSASKIKVGDVITAINGVKTEEVVKEKIKYCPASNDAAQLRNVAGRLLRTNKDFLQLTIENEETSFQENVNTVDVGAVTFWERTAPTTPSHKELANDIGYIYPGTLGKGEIDTIMASFIHKKGLIIDLRCYPSDFIVFSLGKYLMPQPTPFVKFTAGSLENPGQFSFGQVLEVGENNPDYFRGKVVILINEKTQSQAEYTTMAFRVAPKVTVIGSTTAGADGNVSPVVLPGNIHTMISGIGVCYPDGTETQRIGIVPDIAMTPTIAGIRNGKDELLEKANELINE